MKLRLFCLIHALMRRLKANNKKPQQLNKLRLDKLRLVLYLYRHQFNWMN